MPHRIAALIVAAGVVAGGAAAAWSLPLASTCVSLEGVPVAEPSSETWYPQYNATNNCSKEIAISWRANTGEAGGNVSCSDTLMARLQPGSSDDLDAGPLPPGVTSRVSWCVEYHDAQDQKDSGYMSCSEVNLPGCPQLQ